MALARADRILSFANSCYFPVLFARSSDRETIILQTGIMALLPCVSEVKENFKQVQGKKFRGYYVGTHYIDQTDSYLDMVEINNGKFTELLGVILKETHKQCGRLVWTGITGPETSQLYERYRMFANAIEYTYGDDMKLREGVLYKFQIVRVRIYQRRRNIAEGRYLCGVNFTLRIVKRY